MKQLVANIASSTALTWAWLGALYLGYTRGSSLRIFSGVFGYYRPTSEVVCQTTIAGVIGLGALGVCDLVYARHTKARWFALHVIANVRSRARARRRRARRLPRAHRTSRARVGRSAASSPLSAQHVSHGSISAIPRVYLAGLDLPPHPPRPLVRPHRPGRRAADHTGEI